MVRPRSWARIAACTRLRSRSFARMYDDISAEGLQPVLNDYLYV